MEGMGARWRRDAGGSQSLGRGLRVAGDRLGRTLSGGMPMLVGVVHVHCLSPAVTARTSQARMVAIDVPPARCRRRGVDCGSLEPQWRSGPTMTEAKTTRYFVQGKPISL